MKGLGMADIDIGKISEALNNKIDLPMGDSQDGIDFVVDWQDPTSTNGYTWYRKYKSGWVEQGGMQQGAVSVSNGSEGNLGTITLPVPMRDAYYYANASAGDYLMLIRNDATSTTIVFKFGTYTASRTLYYCKWCVTGYSA